MRHLIWLTLLPALISLCASAQELEYDIDSQFLPEDVSEDISSLLEKDTKGDLNTISVNQLISLSIPPIMAERIVFHRKKYGLYLNLYELQSIKGMSPQLFSLLFNLLQIGRIKTKPTHEPKTTLRLRLSPPDEKMNDSLNLLERSKLYLMAKYHYSKDIKAAIIMEKDHGEQLIYDSGSKGPDYSSGYVQWTNATPSIKQIVLGDYSIRFGQGLMVNNQYLRSNSSLGHVSKLTGKKIKPYGSINENGGFRGLATSIKFSQNWESSIFTAINNRDATLYLENNFEYVTLSTSGIHSTELTKAKRDFSKEVSWGASLTRKWNLSSVSINGIHNRFTHEVRKPQDLQSVGNPTYRQSAGISIDQNIFYKNFNWYGETAIKHDGSWASLQGLMVTPHSSTQAHLVLRHYPSVYLMNHFQAFGSASSPRNETGLYTSMNIKFGTRWSAFVSFDFWKRPWISHQNDGTAKGQEFQLTVRHKNRKKYEWYSSFKLKGSNQYHMSQEKTQSSTYANKWSMRTHCSFVLERGVEIRSRIELNNFIKNSPFKDPSYLSFVDLIYKPIASNFSFTARMAFFDVLNFERRIYGYENNLTHVFSIPFYQGTGRKYYVNAKYKLFSATLEGRLEYKSFLLTDKPDNAIQSGLKYSFQITVKL